MRAEPAGISIVLYHLGAATKCLVRTTKGTGTSTYRDLLKEMIVNTSEAMIGGGDGQSSQ